VTSDYRTIWVPTTGDLQTSYDYFDMRGRSLPRWARGGSGRFHSEELSTNGYDSFRAASSKKIKTIFW
jgi:hypothetical protein